MESTTPEVPSNGAVIPAAPPEAPRNIPYWHTLVLVLVLGVLSLLNTHSGHGAHSGHGRARMYLATMAYEWLLTGYVLWGVRRWGRGIRELIGGRWQRFEDFLLDIALGIGAWLTAVLILAVVASAIGMNHANSIEDARRQIGFLAPSSTLEIFLWVGLSATAGICEEILFRGYLQQQCMRLLGNRWLALVVVSIFFGLGHGYEGPQRMVLIGLLGFCFGVLSFMRRSLRPAMVAHTLQDTISGLLMHAIK